MIEWGDKHKRVLASGQLLPLHDLPVCLSGRWCIDESPYEARVINLMTTLTPLSTATAIAFLLVLIAALVLIALGLRARWRSADAPRWLVALPAMLLIVGVLATWSVRRRSEVISEIYSNIYGQPSASAPASLFGSWPSVMFVGQASAIFGLAALVGHVVTTRAKRRPPIPSGSEVPEGGE